jgi:hypothetical protein
MEKHLSMTEFYNEYGSRFVNVNGDDGETGSFRIFEKETERAIELQKMGFIVCTIWQPNSEQTEETVSIEFENSYDHPFVTGFMFLEPDEMLGITKEELNIFKEFLDSEENYYQNQLEDYFETHGDEIPEYHHMEDWDEFPLDKTHPFYYLYRMNVTTQRL